MEAEKSRCERCILPRSYPGLSFDERGVCELCTAHKPRRYLGEEALKEKVQSILREHKSRNATYDCIVGFSGGRDSTYLLYCLRKILGLRVLAYCAQHTFVPPVAEGNIRRVSEALGVDVQIERHAYLQNCIRHFMLSWIHRPSAALVTTLCTGCRFGIFRGLYAAARAQNIPVVIVGGTPLERARYKTNLLRANPRSRGTLSLAAGYVCQIAKNVRLISKPSCVVMQIDEYRYSQGRRMFRKHMELIGPFYRYLHWIEADVNRTIKEQLCWQCDGRSTKTWKTDCEIAPLKSYMYRAMLGFNDDDDHLSWLVRDGQITREEALDRLRKDREVPMEAVKSALARLDIDYADFEEALSRAALQ